MTAVWIVVLILSVALYGFLLAYVLPKAVLKAEFNFMEIGDRGLKNIKETDGRSIVYQPSLENRKYISQYVISERNGKKILLCKLEPNVKYINYDIIMFNGLNKVFKVLNVKEVVANDYTQKIELDESVAYVSINVNEVNDQSISTLQLSSVPTRRKVFYALLSTGATIVEIFLAKLCCSYIFGGVFAESFMLGGKDLIITIAIIVIAICINVPVLFATLKGNSKKGKERE